MKSFLAFGALLAAAVLGLPPPAAAQLTSVITASCTTAPTGLTAGVVFIDTTGRLCTNGPATIADGGNVAQGTTTDAACATDNGTCTVIALLKRENQRLTTVIAGIPVTNAGTFATQSAVTAASGAFASGSHASGAFASGAFASGSVASGAFASGALASGSVASGAIAAGAQVDLLTMRGTKAAGTAAANSLLAGAVYNTTTPTLTDGQQVAAQVSIRGGLLLGGAGYPAGATPLTASATGTTGATTATLATGATIKTYICGFAIRTNATAAATGNATVTGTVTATLNFTQWTAPLASGIGLVEERFSPCIPASAVNTGIAVVSAAPGSGGTVSVTAWGYTLEVGG